MLTSQVYMEVVSRMSSKGQGGDIYRWDGLACQFIKGRVEITTANPQHCSFQLKKNGTLKTDMSNCQLYTFTANYRWRPQRVQKLRPLHLNFSLVFFSLYYASIAFTRAQPWWKEFPHLSTWSCALCELGCLYGHSFCYCWWCSPKTLSSHCFAFFPYFKSTWMLPGVSSLLTVWHSIVGYKVRIQELYHLGFFFFLSLIMS